MNPNNMFTTVKSQNVSLNECSPNPSQNGATCVDLVGGHRCDCAQGYSGSSCETSNFPETYGFAVLKPEEGLSFFKEIL